MSKKKPSRSKLLAYLFLVIIIVTALYSGYYYFIGSRSVATENAYVGAEIAQVAPAIGGIVKSINFKNTDHVKKGDILVVLDDVDARLALARASANLAIAEANLSRAKLDYDRRHNLAGSGSVSDEEVSNAELAYKSAQAEFDLAKSAIDKANIDLKRTTIIAPISGVVAKRQVQLGQRVQIGATLMSIVPIKSLHVNANFKEVQLKKVHLGQDVKMHSDLYGKSVVFHGKVIGISGGTGAAFAIIPAQNATGNWIKVVQRLPIRVSLNSDELEEHPLRVGLSMHVDIDIFGE